MGLAQPITLRVLDRTNGLFMVQFTVHLEDTLDIDTTYIPILGNFTGPMVRIELLNIQSPERDNIPPMKMMQFSVAQRGTSTPTPTFFDELYIFNPDTQQVVVVEPTPPLGRMPSTVNACIPFFINSTGTIIIARNVTPDEVPTGCFVDISCVLLSYDTGCYWNGANIAAALNPTYYP
jgi:hypothetical protein